MKKFYRASLLSLVCSVLLFSFSLSLEGEEAKQNSPVQLKIILTYDTPFPSDKERETQTREWTNPVDGWSVSYWTDKTTYSPDEPIVLYRQEKYLGDTPCLREVFFGQNYSPFLGKHTICTVEALDGYILSHTVSENMKNQTSSKAVKKTSFGSQIPPVIMPDFDSRIKEILPDEKLPISACWLNRYYDMTLSGKYKIIPSVFSAPSRDSSGEEVQPKEMIIEVRPRKSEEATELEFAKIKEETAKWKRLN